MEYITRLEYLLPLISILVSVIWLLLWRLNRWFQIALLVLSAPGIAIQYFYSWWVWGGDGLFTLVAFPITTVVIVLGTLFITRPLPTTNLRNRVLGFYFLSPWISVCLVYLAAWVVGYKINIM